MSLFHTHKWVSKQVNILVEVPRWVIEGGFQNPGDGDPVTAVLYVCSECGDSKVKELRGRWSLTDLKSSI